MSRQHGAVERPTTGRVGRSRHRRLRERAYSGSPKKKRLLS